MYDLQQATANVASKITELKDFANTEYNDAQASQLKLRLNTDLDKLLNHLNFLSGTEPIIQSTEPMFKPLTEFMGDPITLPKQIKPEDLQPSDADRELYLQKVNKLYEEIDTIAEQGILNSYTIPEDVMVLRGVAKKAGIEGYEDRPIDEAFINNIVKAKAAKIAGDKQQQEIDRKLKEQEGNTNNTDEEDKEDSFDHELTEQDLDLNPDLVQQGLKAGDIIQVPTQEDHDLTAEEVEAHLAGLDKAEPIGNKVVNPDVQAAEVNATEAKIPAAPGNEPNIAPESTPAVAETKTVTPPDSATNQAKQQEKNTGNKSKSK